MNGYLLTEIVVGVIALFAIVYFLVVRPEDH